MAIKNKRQSSTTASPAAPASLNYGEIAIANDGTIYAGDKSNKAASKVSFADTCDLAGNAVNASAADSAVSATKASQDASGNTITTSYGSSIDVSGNTIRLKSKSGAVLSTITSPYATRAGSCNSIQIYNSNWNGTDLTDGGSGYGAESRQTDAVLVLNGGYNGSSAQCLLYTDFTPWNTLTINVNDGSCS